MTNMTSNEMNDVVGGLEDGGGWKCFAGGALVGIGIVTGELPLLLAGVEVAISHC